MPKVSIIMPVCNNDDVTKSCIESIERKTTDFELIIIDNCSKSKIESRHRIIRNESNAGYPAAINQGLKVAQGEIVVLLNNDVIVTKDWIKRIAFHFSKYDIVGPLSNEVSGVQKYPLRSIKGREDIDRIAGDIYRNNCGQSIPCHRAVFFCVAIKKEVIDKVGFLDEIFTPGNFEDDDYCLRAIQAGFSVGIAKDVFIYHYGSMSFKKDSQGYANLLRTNRAKFLAKWNEAQISELIQKNVFNRDEKLNSDKPDMTLVMIVKNEEVGLQKAIESARPYVRHVVVCVDESSNQETKNIAATFADEVKSFKFEDDFAKARNFAHQGVKTKWCMFLDGHEEVAYLRDIKKYLNSDCDGIMIPIEMDNKVTFNGLRIYRTGNIFDGAVHEKVNCKKIIRLQNCRIIHNRLKGQSEKQVVERAIQRDDLVPRLMKKDLEKNPKNTRSLFHLALFYQSKGNFKEATRYAKLFLKYGKHADERWFMRFQIAITYLAQNRLFRAFWETLNCEREMPGRWEIYKLRGLIFFQRGWYHKANVNFVKSFVEKRATHIYEPWPYEPATTWNLIGESYYRQSLPQKAAIAFKRASEIEQNSEMREFYGKRGKLMRDMAGL